MSSPLNPPIATMNAVRASINATLGSADLNVDAKALIIAGSLSTVNLWASQIPALLEGATAPAGVNLVFSIRKDLYHAPQFISNVLGIPYNDLPAAFHEFNGFIHKLIDSQKADKEKVSSLSFNVYSRARG